MEHVKPTFKLDEKYLDDYNRLAALRILDDDFMSKIFEDTQCAEFLLHIILNRSDLKVSTVHTQYTVKNLTGRSVRLDILTVDTADSIYNIEIQRNSGGANVKRARYNSSIIDANITEPGDDYSKLNTSYVIFINEHDVLGNGLPIYHIHRTIDETGRPFGDGSYIIYVNSKIMDDTPLGRLMHDFYCTRADDMYCSVLADRVKYFKETEKGVSQMCSILDEMRLEAAKKTSLEIAGRLLSSGHTAEETAVLVNLPIEEIRSLLRKVSA